jgi:hypothetical protein
LAELESRTSSIRVHEPLLVPGLLQTDAYTRAVCLTAGDSDQEIDDYVNFRLARQRIIEDGSVDEYHVVIHEGALRTCVGDPHVTRKQLQRLIEAARMPHVTVQVFPFEAGAYSAFSRSFAIFGGSTPELSTVRLEQPVNNVLLRERDHIARYTDIFHELSRLALRPVDPDARPESHERRDSLGLIQHILYTL